MGRSRIDDQDAVIEHYEPRTHPQEIAERATFAMPLPHPTLLIRREVLESVPYRSAFWCAGDFDFVARATETYSFATLPIPLYRHRRHGAAISQHQGLLQEASACVVRVATARRRRGHPEGLEELLRGATSLLAASPSRADIQMHYARLALREGAFDLAAFLARETWRSERRVDAALIGSRGVARALLTQTEPWRALFRAGVQSGHAQVAHRRHRGAA